MEHTKWMPHGYCYLWDPQILLAHIISDGLITFAYFVIPISFTIVANKLKSLGYPSALLLAIHLCSTFVVSCGVTHVFDIIIIFSPVYDMEAVFLIWTAIVSIFTAYVIFFPLRNAFQTIPKYEQVLNLQESIEHLEKKTLELENEHRNPSRKLGRLPKAGDSNSG